MTEHARVLDVGPEPGQDALGEERVVDDGTGQHQWATQGSGGGDGEVGPLLRFHAPEEGKRGTGHRVERELVEVDAVGDGFAAPGPRLAQAPGLCLAHGRQAQAGTTAHEPLEVGRDVVVPRVQHTGEHEGGGAHMGVDNVELSGAFERHCQRLLLEVPVLPRRAGAHLGDEGDGHGSHELDALRQRRVAARHELDVAPRPLLGGEQAREQRLDAAGRLAPHRIPQRCQVQHAHDRHNPMRASSSSSTISARK